MNEVNVARVNGEAPWAHRYEWLVLCISVVLYIIIYVPSINGDFLWDDDANVSENSLIQDTRFSALLKTWLNPTANQQYYPMTHTFFWACHAIWGLKTPGYHVVNMLLHFLVVIGLWRWLRAMDVKGAVFASAAVLIHPINVESVAWITEMKNTVSGMYIMFAGVCYAKYRRLDCSADKFHGLVEKRGALSLYFFSFILYVCALFSKTVTCSFPAVLILLIWWKHGRWQRRDFIELVPLFIVGFGMGILTWWLEAYHVGTDTIGYDYSLLERVLISGRVFWFYILKLLWPYPLNFSYEQWDIDVSIAWQYIFPITSAGLLILSLVMRRFLNRGLFVVISIYSGVLSPTIGLIGWYYAKYSFVGDHFVYLPAMAIVAFVTHCLVLLIDRWRCNRGFVYAFAVLLGIGYAFIGHSHAYNFKNNERLFNDVLMKNPRSWLAYSNLGELYNEEGRYEEAKAVFLRGSQVLPEKVDLLTNLANIYVREGDIEHAIRIYEKAVALEHEDGRAWMNYGVALMKKGEFAASENAFEKSLTLNELNIKHVSANLSVVQLRLGEIGSAMTTLKSHILFDPTDEDPWLRLWGIGVEYQRMPRVLQIIDEVESRHSNHPAVRRYKFHILSSLKK